MSLQRIRFNYKNVPLRGGVGSGVRRETNATLHFNVESLAIQGSVFLKILHLILSHHVVVFFHYSLENSQFSDLSFLTQRHLHLPPSSNRLCLIIVWWIQIGIPPSLLGHETVGKRVQDGEMRGGPVK